jgi:hypothetical protein
VRGARQDEGIQKQRYLRALAETGTVSAGVRAAATSWGTVHKWRELDPVFSLAEHQARTEFGDALEEEAKRRAFNGVPRPVFHGGKRVGTVTEYSDRLLEMLLKGAKPEKYHDKLDLEVRQVIKAVGGFDPTEVLGPPPPAPPA